MTTPQAAQLHTHHQGGAHQVPFNLDDAPQNLGPVHIRYNDLGEPYDPAEEVGIPVPTLQPVDLSSLHDRFGDSASSSDDAPMDDDLSFVKGSATHGDVHDFCYKMLRLIRGGQKAAYRLPDQLQAWSPRCDKITDRTVQAAIAEGFIIPLGGGGWLQAWLLTYSIE